MEEKSVKIIIGEPVKVTACMNPMEIRTESEYLITSNKEKCRLLLSKGDLNEADIIETFISLHLVLEVSLNSLFRRLSLIGIKKTISEIKIAENIDRINFKDKMVLFIYNSKFNFDDKLDKATSYHSIIEKLKSFSEVRNKLFHGYSIIEISSEDKIEQSSLKKKINLEYLGEQINKFESILEGMRFYLDRLESDLSQSEKETLKKTYLDDSFLPNKN